ncbi:hypothetical protein BJ546DRAFT_969950 [Cryomyces antarcticus]
MQYLFTFALVAYASLAASKPIPAAAGLDTQQPLLHAATDVSPFSQTKSQYLDATTNTIGIEFTTAGDHELRRVWLPLGKRISPRDVAALPVHPATARITTVTTSGEHSTLEQQTNRVLCLVHPLPSPEERSTQAHDGRSIDRNTALSVRMRRAHGLVNFEEGASRWFLAGREVESYECYVDHIRSLERMPAGWLRLPRFGSR